VSGWERAGRLRKWSSQEEKSRCLIEQCLFWRKHEVVKDEVGNETWENLSLKFSFFGCVF
jgi:hypothetical protein